ncbi:hypothetical protein LTR94_033385, partial [Friedmanniomyces endolithicus]
DLRPERHRRGRQDQSEGREGRRADRPSHGPLRGRLSGRHGPAERQPARPCASRHRLHPRHRRPDPGHRRRRLRLCGRGPCAVRRLVLSGLRRPVGPEPGRHDRRRPRRGRALQEEPPRLRAVEAFQGRRA